MMMDQQPYPPIEHPNFQAASALLPGVLWAFHGAHTRNFRVRAVDLR